MTNIDITTDKDKGYTVNMTVSFWTPDLCDLQSALSLINAFKDSLEELEEAKES